MDNVDEILNGTSPTQSTQSVDAILSGNSTPDTSVASNSPETTPQDVTQASSQVGSQADNGECQRFVEKVTTGKTGIFPSATDAANYYQQSGKMKSLQDAKPGDLIYFDDPNQPDGHVGILTDTKGDFVSATYNGVQTNNLTDWINQTGQSIRGVVSP
jgi:hypothetical protein